ncbi:MAG: hypothetical protein GY953_21410 [bacterium]|nr:hypothetical protein [bacterium]
MRNSSRLLTVFLIGALAVSAQGYGQGQGAGNGRQNGNGNGTGQPQLDLNQQSVVEGEITVVNIGFGAQYPSIQVNNITIKIAPSWFLLENDFELAENDLVRVLAAPSTAATDPYLHALSIVKTTTGEEILLRDETGRPLWIGGRGQGQRRGPGQGQAQQPRDPRGNGAQNGGCVDPTTIQTVNGVIEQVTLGAGIRQPTLAVNVDGQIVSVKIGPARVLLAADFELKAGDPITVRFATAACTGELVALDLTNKAGVTLKLRNDDGSRAW